VIPIRVIKDKGKVIAIIYRNEDWVKGLNFLTPSDLNIQVSSWYYHKGEKVASHIHKVNPRQVDRTHEVTYVKQGKMKVLLYDENKKLIKEFISSEGDLTVYAYGGHGYEILEDNTQVIEVKNGPFIGVSLDKEKFEG